MQVTSLSLWKLSARSFVMSFAETRPSYLADFRVLGDQLVAIWNVFRLRFDFCSDYLIPNLVLAMIPSIFVCLWSVWIFLSYNFVTVRPVFWGKHQFCPMEERTSWVGFLFYQFESDEGIDIRPGTWNIHPGVLSTKPSVLSTNTIVLSVNASVPYTKPSSLHQ